jgi:F420-dependent oxidoreductase-like protein
LRTTRECIEIVRAIFRGEGPIEHEGLRYQLPWRGDGSTGLGKPMRPGLHTRSDIPVLIAAIGPKNVALAVEVADGLLPMLWNPVRWRDAFGDALGGVDLSRFDIAPTVPIAIGDDIGTCRDKVRPLIGLYVGGMGAKGKNFYNDLVRRYGFEAEAENVQDLYLGGDRKAAVAAVPDRLVDELALVGPREHIAEQLEVWAASGVGTLILASSRPHVLRTMAELAL